MSKKPPIARWAIRVEKSDLQRLLSAASQPGTLSFALGLPDPRLFPMDDLSRAYRTVAADHNALQYAPHFSRLKREVVQLMKRRGVVCEEFNVFLTAGAQQGLSLLARLLLNTHDTVFHEEYTYPGFLQAIQPSEPNCVAIPTDLRRGIDLDALEHKLQCGVRPAFLYTTPEGHNPMGGSLDVDRRMRLVELARQWQMPIIEDDAYGFLQYDGQNRVPLRGLNSNLVFYVGSFSKILAPSLRVGWLVVPEELLLPLSVLKESTDIDTATLGQRLICSYLEQADLNQHLTILQQAYKAKRDRMVEALDREAIEGLTWSLPRSGIFLWVYAGAGVDTALALEKALREEHLAFVPGSAFSPHNLGVSSWLRLNFSHPSLTEIDDGIGRLKRVLERCRPSTHQLTTSNR
jgi:2-aminoadipate transaminase